MRTRRRVTTIAMLMVSGLLALTSAAPAAAQVDLARKEAARQNYKEAEIKLKEGNHARALELYRLADSVLPNPAPKYKIALCLDTLGRDAEAVAAYQTFLDSAPPPDKLGAQIGEARVRLDILRQKVARAATPPPRVVVQPAPVAPAGGYVQPRPVLVLQPVQPGPGGEVVFRRQRSNVPAFVVLGVAAVGVGVGTAFGAVALGDKSSFNKTPTTAGADKTDRDALISDISFAAAVAFGVTGVVLLVTNPARPEAAGVRPFFTPYAGPGAAGAVGGLKF